MRFEGRRRARSGPNLTPLIDVVFLLLIFFMLTAHFVNDETIPIALPEASSAMPVNDSEMPTITLGADGATRFQGVVVNDDELERRLAASLVGMKTKNVRIRGDRGANLEGAVRVIDVSRKAGAKGVELITEQPTLGGAS